MTFEEKLALAVEFNKRVAAGQKVGQIATADLVRTDALSDEEIEQLVSLYPKWASGIQVKVADLYQHNDFLYEVIQAHITQEDWEPQTVPALWKSRAPEAVIPDWVQPTGAHDSYNIGDKVLFEGQVYESVIGANTWSPSTYPQGWKAV